MADLLWNCLGIFAIAWGGPTMVMGFMRLAAFRANGDPKQRQFGMVQILLGCAAVIGGLATPGRVNWLPADGMSGICHLKASPPLDSPKAGCIS
jgi:hypothetical protein